mgnify:CR=1 FL=1
MFFNTDPKILKNENDFRIEGYTMRNCMAKQFTNGIIHLYISLQCGNSKINIQYNKKGELVQAYGKANTPVKEKYSLAMKELTKRMVNFENIDWTREKFNFINELSQFFKQNIDFPFSPFLAKFRRNFFITSTPAPIASMIQTTKDGIDIFRI